MQIYPGPPGPWVTLVGIPAMKTVWPSPATCPRPHSGPLYSARRPSWAPGWASPGPGYGDIKERLWPQPPEAASWKQQWTSDSRMPAGGAGAELGTARAVGSQRSLSVQRSELLRGKSRAGAADGKGGKDLPAGHSASKLVHLSPFLGRGRQTPRIWGHSPKQASSPRQVCSAPFCTSVCLTVKTVLEGP